MNNCKNIKNPKGAGRPKKYSDDVLLEILDLFLINKYKNQISASLIANYARNELGYEGIKYYHFTQRELIANKIEEIGKDRKNKIFSSKYLLLQNIEINTLVDNNLKNPNRIKEKIRSAQLGELEMYNSLVKIDTENRELKTEIKECNNSRNELELHVKELEHGITLMKEKVKILKKVINVDNQLKLLDYILKTSLIDCGDFGKQYLTILKKCGIITEADYDTIINKNTLNRNLGKDTSKNLDTFKRFNIELDNYMEKVDDQDELIDDELEEVTLDELSELLDT